MFKNKKTLQVIMFISVIVINITTLLSGIKHHDNLLITIGAIGCVLISLAAILQIMKSRQEKRMR